MATQIGSLKRLLESPKYLKFCFVRNPFTRILSCYLDKIVRNQPQKSAILKQLGRSAADLNQPVAFDEFLDAVAALPLSGMDDHWCPQWFHTMQGRIVYDVVGRFESFHDDFVGIAERLSIDFDRYYCRETRNETGSQHLLAQYYDRRLVELVGRVYAADFAGFGSSLELPL